MSDGHHTVEPLCSDTAEGGERSKRRQILQGAREVFLAQGFDGASMGEIARASGVSKGTLYVYFDSKDKLFEVLTLEEKKTLAEVLFKLDPENPDVRAELSELGASFLKFMAQPEHISSIRMVIGAAEKFPRIGQTFYEAGPQRGIERLSAYLARQAEAGRLSIRDPDTAAGHFLALCQAETMKRLLFAVDTELGQNEIDARVRDAIRVFFAAYGPKAAAG
ncbi:TetR/AcrR family transcriptional regulator [Microvirga brassicacearum]|uniref:TetR/AcrR family transcriptional regulator n=1 Tax=Microvirga brassicacearum TaxID=2580413 RepID=A0A5N3PAB8_9HYPH|nr:TetR/AcrR family transcriptional regulator [Microvirga brassicacearum]KAB0266688.1 TetR/AcrR family transcriptional regulator [Microvirga brassicacearum]